MSPQSQPLFQPDLSEFKTCHLFAPLLCCPIHLHSLSKNELGWGEGTLREQEEKKREEREWFLS